jgi:hypothetical protein
LNSISTRGWRARAARSCGFSSTLRWTSSEVRLLVMPDTSDSSAGTAAGSTISHVVPLFLRTVRSPEAAFTDNSRILSAVTEKTLALVSPASGPDGFLDSTK